MYVSARKKIDGTCDVTEAWRGRTGWFGCCRYSGVRGLGEEVSGLAKRSGMNRSNVVC
jgi:hypothetical protein